LLGEEIHAPVDTRQDETDRIDNRIDVMSKTFLGLTVACARCHDHKFDAISQRDYYALAGFFVSSSQRLARFETLDNEREVARQLHNLKERWVTNLASKLSAARAPVLSKVKDYLSAASEAAKTSTNAAPKAGMRLRVAELPQATTEISRTSRC
jgi:cytochrome c553